MTPKTIIETPRMRLRTWKPEDLEPFAVMNADPEVMRYFPAPCTREQTEDFYNRIRQEFAEYGYGLYAAEEKASGDFMGFIGFHWARLELDFCPCVEIGWRLAKAYWNKGYATEGATACLVLGLGELKLDRVYSFTSGTNLPSRRVMEKIGMTLDRTFQHPNIPEGHPLRPHVCFLAKA